MNEGMNLKNQCGIEEPAEDEEYEDAVVIRAAVPADWESRASLVRRGFASYHWQAFIFFFFQELTLEACVLCGAVLFIFLGVSPSVLLLLLPCAGAVLCGIGVMLSHMASADTHAGRLRAEQAGLVAEYRGPLRAEAPASPRVIACLRRPPGPSRRHAKVVGTISISEFWGPRNSGWLHLFAVDPEWQRRGIGRALVSAARGQGVQMGLESLETALSHMHVAARTLLHAAGWELRGSYHRPMLGAALTLPMARLGLELPYA